VGRGRCAGASRVRCGEEGDSVQGSGRCGSGQRAESSASRKEKELTSGPGVSAGDVERRAGELGLEHRWAKREVEEEEDYGHVPEKKRVCGPAERWEMEVGRARGTGPQGKEAG
jgi:hypothetical protein